MHSWDPLSPWFSTSDKFSQIAGGVPTPATIFPSLREDHVNNHLSLGVPPPNTDVRTPCQVEVPPCKSEGIEPFNLVNSPPGQVEDVSSHTVNSPLCQVGVYPRKSEGIKPFTLVNSPPGQVEDASSHTVNSPLCQVGAMSSRLINSLSGPLQVLSPMSCTVPASVSDRVTPVPSPSPPVSVMSPPCFISSHTTSVCHDPFPMLS